MQIAPTADDLWFWAMEKRQGIKTSLTDINGYGLHRAVNRLYVYMPERKGTLYLENEVNGANDKQFEELINYYKLAPSE